MAQVPFCSAKGVLAKVARNLGGNLPNQYHDDILEWVPEAIDMLSNTKTLETTSTAQKNCPGEYRTQNHVVCLPKDMCAILAVEDENGRIIPNGGDITDLSSPSNRYNGDSAARQIRASVFEVNPLTHQTSDGTPTTTPGTTIPLYGQDLEGVDPARAATSYYKISGNYLQTSFECGFVRIHYLKRPLDKQGYPLMPDNENFKTAIYWYVLMMLIGAGYDHKVFRFEDCEGRFEKFAARAINEITYPSLDEMARIHRSTVRLIPPYQFYEDFFVNSEQPEILRK